MEEVQVELMMETWDIVKDYVNVKEREDACARVIRLFEQHGISDDDLETIRGEDQDIDNVLDKYYDFDDDPEYIEEDEDNLYYDDDY